MGGTDGEGFSRIARFETVRQIIRYSRLFRCLILEVWRAPYFNPSNRAQWSFAQSWIPKGRIQVMIDSITTLANTGRRLDVGTCSIRVSGSAVELGINYAIYAMTH
jgi:hypothetical protein